MRCESIGIACSGYLGLLIAMVLLAAPAHAQEAAAAARAFSNAQAAELAEDFGRAAELYELADRIAPTREALRSATRMRKEAGDFATAATHAEELLRRYPGDARSAEIAEGVLEHARNDLGRLTVRCEPRCELEADGFAVGVESLREHVLYLDPGRHELVASFPDGRTRTKEIEASAGREGQLKIEPPKEDPEAQEAVSFVENMVDQNEGGDGVEEEGSGLHMAVFLSGLAVTLGVGAAAVWSGVDTENLVDEYSAMRTDALYEEGLDRQRRTNILAGVAGAAGLATGLIGIWTDWKGGDEREDQAAGSLRFTVGASPDGGSVAVRGNF